MSIEVIPVRLETGAVAVRELLITADEISFVCEGLKFYGGEAQHMASRLPYHAIGERFVDVVPINIVERFNLRVQGTAATGLRHQMKRHHANNPDDTVLIRGESSRHYLPVMMGFSMMAQLTGRRYREEFINKLYTRLTHRKPISQNYYELFWQYRGPEIAHLIEV